MNLLIAVVIVIALAVGGYYAYERYKIWKYGYPEIKIDMPETKADGLLYGYYGASHRTWEQVKNNVNLFWYIHFYPVEWFIEEIKSARFDMKFAVDIGHILAVLLPGDGKKIYSEEAPEKLREFFELFRAAGVLHRINYLVPIDEAPLRVRDSGEFARMVATMKSVAKEFEELRDVKFTHVYPNGGQYWSLEEFDVVAVDWYKQKSYSLTKGVHAHLMKNILPHQKVFLFPGAGYGHDHEPWVAYVHKNAGKVEGVVPFVWFEPDDKAVKDDVYSGLEVHSFDERERWVNAGWAVMNRQRNTAPEPDTYYPKKEEEAE